MKNPPYYLRRVTSKGRIKRFKGLEGKYLIIIPLKIKTRKEADSFKSSCRSKTQYCNFSFLGKRCSVYTDGFTLQMKPLIPLIINKVLNDCIRNPNKFLKGIKVKEDVKDDSWWVAKGRKR